MYNNLANLYGHIGPIKKAFEYYAKAIELNPREARLLSQLRHDRLICSARMPWSSSASPSSRSSTRPSTFTAKPSSSTPTNFPLASDVAQTYYGIKPLRLEDALNAWTNTLALAHDEIEREGVYLHFARLKLQADRFTEVRAHLNAVTNDMYAVLKSRIARNLDEQERKVRETNAPPAIPGPKQSTPGR